jgi:iron(III) transport system substrate-binding protein
MSLNVIRDSWKKPNIASSIASTAWRRRPVELTGKQKVEVAMGRLWTPIFAIVLAAALAATMAPGAAAQGAPTAWDELVTAAKREGRVVVMGPPFSDVREKIPAAFQKRFGVVVEYVGGRTSETAARLRAERKAGLYTVDVTIGGVQSMATIFHREKMLMPMRPELILPEVTDGSKWKKGELWFIDPEEQYVLRLANYVSPTIYINTDKVKPSDLRFARDLLDPKWKGKISTQDPAVPGSGGNQAAQFYVELGESFVKQLYVDQKPVISSDVRQLTDWLLRGSYPIAFTLDTSQVEDMQKEGLPVMALGDLEDWRQPTTAGFGLLAMFSNAPHPAAAKLFANWLASKEGSDVWARATNAASTRNDIDEASFLPPERIPRPGVKYFDTYDWSYTVTKKEEARLRIKELLGR